jgi:hypothetical protein
MVEELRLSALYDIYVNREVRPFWLVTSIPDNGSSMFDPLKTICMYAFAFPSTHVSTSHPRLRVPHGGTRLTLPTITHRTLTHARLLVPVCTYI